MLFDLMVEILDRLVNQEYRRLYEQGKIPGARRPNGPPNSNDVLRDS